MLQMMSMSHRAGDAGMPPGRTVNSMHHQPHGNLPPGCGGDVKPRLTKDQHEFLETEFQRQHKPSTLVKKGYADRLQVPIEKVNNWFQNRRAKVKQDAKKALQNPIANMAPPNQKKTPAAERHPYMSHSQPQYFASTPNLHQGMSEMEDRTSPYATGRLANSQLDLSLDLDWSLLPTSEPSNPSNVDALMDPLVSGAFGLSPDQVSASAEELNSVLSDYPWGAPGPYNTHFGNDSNFTMSSYSNSASASASNLDIFATSPGASGMADGPQGSGLLANLNTNFPSFNDDSNTQSPATLASGSQYEGSVEGSVTNLGMLDAASPPDIPIWSAGAATDSQYMGSPHHIFAETDGSNQSLQPSGSLDRSATVRRSPSSTLDRSATVRRSPSGFDQKPQLPEELADRRSSSVSVFSDSTSGDTQPVPVQRRPSDLPSSIASRRQRPRPAALGPASLRSSSHASGLPASPGGSRAVDPDHSLRRIRSSGIVASRIKKPGVASAQRSPLAMSFPDVSSESASSAIAPNSMVPPGTAAPGNSLAPPTPMTPGGFSYADLMSIESFAPVSKAEQDVVDGNDIAWSPDVATTARQDNESPPYTPMDKMRLQSASHSRMNSSSFYSEVPPQSAPATQQVFAVSAFPQYAGNTQLAAGFGGLTPASARHAHSRSPSMPMGALTGVPAADQAFAMPVTLEESGMQNITGQFGLLESSVCGITQPMPDAISAASNDFRVHEYTPPEGSGHVSVPSKPQGSKKPFEYTFSNQGLEDFQAE